MKYEYRKLSGQWIIARTTAIGSAFYAGLGSWGGECAFKWSRDPSGATTYGSEADAAEAAKALSALRKEAGIKSYID
jgi:hypothetical protein